MRETLFIGGPWDGRVEDVRENAKFVNAVDGPFGGRVEPHEYTIETIRVPAGCDPDVDFVVAISEEMSLPEAVGALLLAYPLKAAVDRSGFDIEPCVGCGLPVVCLPDGLPSCESCHGEGGDS